MFFSFSRDCFITNFLIIDKNTYLYYPLGNVVIECATPGSRSGKGFRKDILGKSEERIVMHYSGGKV